ncbi:MAG: hypothetical protein QOD37_1779, partial [Gaiellales bacterium]|nr:hypothetical protein [Gaiellales bacterium]
MKRLAATVGLAVSGLVALLLAALLFGSTFGGGTSKGWDAVSKGAETMRVPAATALALIGVVMLLLALRRLLLWRRGRRPRVQITTFSWTGGADAAGSEAAWVTSLFRDQLATLQLDALDALPERAPGAPLVEIFVGVGQGSAVGRAMAGVVRTVLPDCTYAVCGTLRPHDDRPGGHVFVELVDRGRHQTLISVTHSAEDWAQCAREAAMAVAGALYPRVHHRHQGPWTQWSSTVPGTLVRNYHDAAELERADRLEEAIGAYQRALSQDPLNPHLRVCIAMIQERLGLYLDAWATYQAITSETDREAWKGHDRRVRLVAQYRLAIILGYEQAGLQWMRSERPQRSERDKERQDLRAELALSLVEDELFAADAAPRGDPLDVAGADELWLDFRARLGRLELPCDPELGSQHSAHAKPLLALLCGGDPMQPQWRERWSFDAESRVRLDSPAIVASTLRVNLINELLQILALRRLEQLEGWQRPALARGRFRTHRRRLSRTFTRRQIAPAALDLVQTCLRLRLRAARYSTIGPDCDRASHERMLSDLRAAAPPDPSRPRRIWRALFGARDDEWLTHYNAACTIAVPLLEELPTRSGPIPLPLPEGVDREDLVRASVAQLERYAHRAGSGRVASQEGWVGAEDPDLAALTESPRFQEWARHHLSQPLPRKRPVRSIDVGHHLRCVLQLGAQASAAEWLARARDATAAAEDVEGWWRGERDALEVFATACLQFRSWTARLAAVDAVNE